MARHQIVQVGSSAALLLPEELLAQLQMYIGDQVDVSIIDHTLILRSLEDVERQQQLESVIDHIFARRKSAYQQLAQ